ncbi:TPA: tail fiber assembly protein [Citrobacter freundii]
MERILFSVANQAFYGEDYPSLPGDVIEVSDAEHMRLIAGMNDHERRVYAGEGGEWLLSARKPSQWHTWDAVANEWYLSPEDAARIHTEDAERTKSALRAKADAEITWRQGAVDEGMATDEEKASLSSWNKYRVLLMRVNTSEAEIQWPEMPG